MTPTPPLPNPSTPRLDEVEPRPFSTRNLELGTRNPTLPGSWHLETGNSLPSESANPAAASPDLVLPTPLAALLTRHILRDGETILLMLRPSLWYIPFTCLRFAAIVLILMITAQIENEQLHFHARLYNEVGVLVLVARLMVAILQWLGRLYILTDLRALQMSGIFAVDIHDCPLRKVARVRVIYTLKERLLRLGSVEIIPFDDAYPVGLWQTISRPKDVHKVILQAIRRAKQGMAP